MNVLSAVLLLFAVARASADTFYLNLPGIPGESTDARHPGWIVVESFQQGVERPAGSARPSFSDLHFTRTLDKASPLLFAHCVAGRQIKSGLLEAVRPGNLQLRYLQVKLTNILVASFEQGGFADQLPSESASLNFRVVEWTVTVFDSRGNGVTNITCSWNRVTGTGIGGPMFDDADGDSLPDDYERLYGLDLERDDSLLDLDGDGASNLDELRAGTIPDSPDSVFQMRGRKLDGKAALAWTRAEGKQYRLLAAFAVEGPYEFVRWVEESEAAAGALEVETTPGRQFFLITAE